MDAATAGIIGSLAGAAIGLAGGAMTDSVKRKQALRDERRRAYAVFLGALYATVGDLRAMPANRDGGVFRHLDRLIYTEQARWVRDQRGLAATAPHLFSRSDRLVGALAVLQVIELPAEVVVAVEEATTYVEELGRDRLPGLVARWPDVHKRLELAKALL